MEERYQSRRWSGDFGREYTARNPQDVTAMEDLYRRAYGCERAELNREFLAGIDRTVTVLEVGANVGVQLQFLRLLGFTELYALELQWHAIALANAGTQPLRYVQGGAHRLPFRNGAFDLVFTSGVLIHIEPATLAAVIGEIVRVSNRYIWGFEYYSKRPASIDYRGEKGLLWKNDFVARYREVASDLRLVRQRTVPYLKGGNADQMYLLEKSIR